MNALLQYQITLRQYGSRLGTYLLSCRGSPELLQPPSDSIFHGYNVAESGCLLLAETHSALLGHWGLTAAGLPSLDIASPNGLALHSGNMLCFRLELGLLDCSAELLGQEDKVPADSASGTDLLLTDCSAILILVLRILPLELLLLRWTLVLPELLRLIA
jgi:hypothetical protein